MRYLRIIRGEFYVHNGDLFVLPADGGSPQSVKDLLGDFYRKEASVLITHEHPEPPEFGMPGFGCCLWKGACPAGHQTDRGWMFLFRAEGKLEFEKDTIKVGDASSPFVEPLAGHLARIVVLRLDIHIEPEDHDPELLKSLEEAKTLMDGLSRARAGR